MDLLLMLGRTLVSGIPHTRGDGPHHAEKDFQTQPYSPHTWGWTWIKSDSTHFFPVFPTHVGMDLRLSYSSWRNISIPHTRGDGPLLVLQSRQAIAYSPHTWGWTSEAVHAFYEESVFPTHVGMDLLLSRRSSTKICIPHTRGDGPT